MTIHCCLSSCVEETKPSLCCAQYLDCLWAQIQKLKKDRWQERHILRPYIAFDSVLCEALQHNLPPFTPPGHMPDAHYPMPRVIFRMFDYTDAPEVRVTYRLPVCVRPSSLTRPSPFRVQSCPAATPWRDSSLKRTCTVSSRHTGERGTPGERLRFPLCRRAHANVCHCCLFLSAAQLLSYPGKSKIPLNYHIVEVPSPSQCPTDLTFRHFLDPPPLLFLSR